MKPRQRSFDPLLAKGEAAAGFFYLPLHILVLPLLIPLAATYFPSLTEGQSNLIYSGSASCFWACFFCPISAGSSTPFWTGRLTRSLPWPAPFCSI
jgi:hypothetical protein